MRTSVKTASWIISSTRQHPVRAAICSDSTGLRALCESMLLWIGKLRLCMRFLWITYFWASFKLSSFWCFTLKSKQTKLRSCSIVRSFHPGKYAICYLRAKMFFLHDYSSSFQCTPERVCLWPWLPSTFLLFPRHHSSLRCQRQSTQIRTVCLRFVHCWEFSNWIYCRWGNSIHFVSPERIAS